MKCPKCGYNSFEYLDSCKKCKADLTSFKSSLGIRPLFFSAAGSAIPSADVLQIESEVDLPAAIAAESVATSDSGADEMFSFDFTAGSASAERSEKPAVSFDLPLDEPAAPSAIEESFSFDELLTPEVAAPENKAPADPLGDFTFETEEPAAEETSASTAPSTPFDEFSFEDAVPAEQPSKAAEETPPFAEFPFEDNSFLPVEENSFDLDSATTTADNPDDSLLETFDLPETAPTPGVSDELPMFDAEINGELIEELGQDAIIEEGESVQDSPDIFGEFAFEEPPKEEKPKGVKSAAAVVQDFTDEEFKALFAAEEPKEDDEK